jgi:LysR family hydrogen peroxide-inducible transcriptional activator
MDLHQVTLAQMRYAVAVDDTRSFRVAAERCHVSQSGLSMQIQKVEELLDTVLFDRKKKPVLATRAGKAVLEQMRLVLRETERLGQVAAANDEPAGPYRLGVIPTLSPTVLPLFLADFVERHPKIELTVEELETKRMIARLKSDTLDAGIAATPLDVPGLQELVLGREALVAYLPPGDPLLDKQTLRQKDLAERELWVMPEGHCFRTQVLSFCGPKAVEPPARVRFESGSFQTLIRLVDGGLGATILPELVLEDLPAKRRGAQARPLVGPTPVREIGLVTARQDLRRQVSTALAELVRSRLGAALGARPRRARVLDPMGADDDAED